MPDVTTVLGLRNRAILETFYATGVRRSELVGLDLERRRPRPRRALGAPGQGRQGPLRALGERAAAWLRSYLRGRETSAQTLQRRASALFLSVRGSRLSRHYLGELVRHG